MPLNFGLPKMMGISKIGIAKRGINKSQLQFEGS